ncbi:MAG TPA: AAA family ATPase [Pilimelia sp.]|nr:AAA family ATPase [Pilimelia sp.]
MRKFAQIGASGLLRRRLLDELDAARAARLSIVVAPAGFGKTTLLAHYAHTFEGPVGWLSAGPSDADPAELITRLREEFPVPLPVANDNDDLADLVRAVRAALSTDVLLVIDDAQALEGSPAETALEQLLVAAPPKLHVVIGARRMPGLNLSRHELAGLVVIDAERLRFRTWEVEQLLRDVYGEPLPPADIAALTRRLGGWVAGLHLFHLSTRGSSMPERRAAVAALDGRTALCRAYLARTVLAELPPDLHDFLVRTSVFDVLTAERCNRILGRTDSQARLDELSRLQAFTASSDGGRTYHYHEVMRSHLAVTLDDELGAEAARRCHGYAAELLEAEGALAEAARAQARAEDWSAVRRLLQRIGADIAETGVEAWRDVLPAWLVAEDPWLVLAEGRHLFSRGQLSGSLQCYSRAETLFSYEHGRSHCRIAASRSARWLPGPARPGGHWSNALRAASQRHPAMVAAQAERLPDHEGRLVRIVAHLLAGQVEAAYDLIATADLEQPGVTGLCLRLLNAAAAVAAGHEAGPARLAAVAVEADAAQLPWLDRMARAAIALDGTEHGSKTALAVAEECARDGDRWGQALATGVAWLLHAGADNADVDALAALTALCRRLDAAVLEAWSRALHAVATAATDGPDGGEVSEQAAATARSAGVPGAQVAVTVAAARAGGRLPDRMAGVPRLALECGLPLRLVTAWAGQPSFGGPVAVSGDASAVLCLGGFHASFDGQPVDLSKVKPRVRVLMRLLAMHAGRPVHRDVLVNALWPDVPGDAANHNLHVAMWSLRKLLEPESTRGHCRLLIRDGDAYLLNLPGGTYCDVVAVRSALAEARRAQSMADEAGLAAALLAALAGYGGDLLPGDGSAEWVVHEREVLRREVSDAGVTLAALEFVRGDNDAAVAAAERSIAVDRYNTEAWRLLVTVHERGDRAAARLARSRYEQVLAELGLEPAAVATAGRAALSEARRPRPARPRIP